MNRLAQVTDPEALARFDGSCAKLRIEVPPAWAGADIEVNVPGKLACWHCDAGGCDRCGRSGAIRLSTPGRTLPLRLPREPRDAAVIRLPHPFADEALGMLMLEIVAAGSPSPSCRRVSTAVSAERPGYRMASVLFVVLLITAAIIFGRSCFDT
ncbi:MAG: hypothetical protein HOW73_49760 [Polyangiaceae bacterium]|nr:hypothetical protein [Polyangiaceae bacterium]